MGRYIEGINSLGHPVYEFWDTLYQKIFIWKIKNPTQNNPACKIPCWYLQKCGSYRPSNLAKGWLPVPFNANCTLYNLTLFYLFQHIELGLTARKQALVDNIDAWAMWISPPVFLIFNAVYWVSFRHVGAELFTFS